MRIDWWTLALQTFNVLILIWILARFFFRPIVKVVATRQAEANKILADAAATRQQAADARSNAEKAIAKVDAERDCLIAEARTSAQKEKANLLAQASQEIANLRSEAEAALARNQAAAQQAIISHASELSVDIAKRLLGRLATDVVMTAFLDGLCHELRSFSAEEGEGLQSTADHSIEIVTAAPVSTSETRHIGDVLKAAIGSDRIFTFRTDPALIAGIELHSRNMIVRNSWQRDLDRIRQGLASDKRTH